MLKVKAKILKILKEADTYVSGQALCEMLGVSRTAVWKVMRQLEEDGFEIEAVRNRGYRLVSGEDVYSEAELKSVLSTDWLGHNLFFLDEVDSTNTHLRRLAEQGAPEGTLVVAGQQTAGKGRRGRSWVSEQGTGIWMSYLLRPQFAPECASMMTLVAAMAVAAGIREVTGLDTAIKWPNDIVIGGKKICGILTEMSSDMDSIHYVIVGIGINVGMKVFPEEIRETATSLELCAGHGVNRAKLVDAVLRGWERYYEIFLKDLDLSGLIDEYNHMLVNRDREVRVLAPKGDYTGISHGITRTGELLVELPDGTVREVLSGEVSVRGVYGYV
jgi:BirA family biotin operon repressor/biotin-[acetyl-CoA-carboxylase] ligase